MSIYHEPVKRNINRHVTVQISLYVKNLSSVNKFLDKILSSHSFGCLKENESCEPHGNNMCYIQNGSSSNLKVCPVLLRREWSEGYKKNWSESWKDLRSPIAVLLTRLREDSHLVPRILQYSVDETSGSQKDLDEAR